MRHYETWKFPKRLRESREKKGMTQKDLSNKSGISLSQISHYERGRYFPGGSVLVFFAIALDVSIDWLLGQDVL